MYHLINEQIASIIDSFDADHIKNYDWLVAHLHQVSSDEFQKQYRVFWRMNSARLCQDFCDGYFKILLRELKDQSNIKEIVSELYDIPSNS